MRHAEAEEEDLVGAGEALCSGLVWCDISVDVRMDLSESRALVTSSSPRVAKHSSLNHSTAMGLFKDTGPLLGQYHVYLRREE